MAYAIQKRLETLGTIWDGFVAAGAGRGIPFVCVARGSGADVQMVETYVALQDEEAGTSPDLFVRLTAPFTGPSPYCAALAEDFAAQFAAGADQMEEAGVGTDWMPGPAPQDVHLPGTLAAFCASFIAAYDGLFRCLVLVLTPEQVSDAEEFCLWLESFAAADRHPDLRVLVFNPETGRPFGDLGASPADAAPGDMPIVAVDIDLDMEAATDELMRQTVREGPGKDFLSWMNALTTAAGKSNMAGAGRAAARAFAIAEDHGWTDQKVVVLAALAAGHLGARNFGEAIATYERAVTHARACAAADHPAGARLVMTMQTLLGTACFSDSQYPRAAQEYLSASAAARDLGDALLEMDNARMAGYSSELAGQDRDAWEHNQAALAAAEGMPPEDRSSSTLPYAGQALLRLLGDAPDAPARRQEVLDAMSALLGEPWDGQMMPGAAE